MLKKITNFIGKSSLLLIVLGLLVTSLASGISNLNTFAEAATEGYFFATSADCDTDAKICGDKKDCDFYDFQTPNPNYDPQGDTQRTLIYNHVFCTSGTDSKDAWRLQCKIGAGSDDQTCEGEAGVKYSSCNGYAGEVAICTRKEVPATPDTPTTPGGIPPTAIVNKTDNGYNCKLTDQNTASTYELSKISLSCEKDGKPITKPNQVCVGYKEMDKSLDLRCTKEIILFGDLKGDTLPSGDNSVTLANWPTGSGRVFATKDGGSLYIKDWKFLGLPSGTNAANDVCGTLSRTVLSTLTLGIGPLIQGMREDAYRCPGVQNLGEFKAKLKDEKKVANADQIVDLSDIQGSVQNQLQGCKLTTAADANKLAADAKTAGPSSVNYKLKEQLETLKTKQKWNGTDDIILCNNNTLACIPVNRDDLKKAGVDVNKIKLTCINKNLVQQNFSETGGEITNTGTSNAGAPNVAKSLLEGLFNIVAILLLWFIYFCGWVAIAVLFLLGWVILVFLRINPAGSDFFTVAIAPWSVLITIANIMILGSFLYVGFGYILNIKNVKKSIQEFLTSIVIVALSINFTILGVATVINITQGVGDVFIYSYVATKGTVTPDNINRALIGNVIDGIGRVSILRCGKQMQSSVKNGGAADCKIGANVFEQAGDSIMSPLTAFFSQNSGAATAMLISEAVFLIMICVAIYVFWKAAYMATMRIVGLWLLMVTSPIALATYLLPFESLKPIGKKWVDKFIKWTSFYPIFVFSLVLVGVLTEKFAQVTYTNKGALSYVGGGIGNLASIFLNSVDTFAQAAAATVASPISNITGNYDRTFEDSLRIILGGAISIGALYMTLNFMDKDLENFTKKGLSAVGKWSRPFLGAYGATTRFVGGSTGFVAGSAVGSIRKNFLIPGKLEKINQQLSSGNLSNTQRSRLESQKETLTNKLKDAEVQGQEWSKKTSFIPNIVADTFQIAPDIVQLLGKTPKKVLEGITRSREGKEAELKETMYGNLERSIRKLPFVSSKLNNYLNGDEDFSRFVGLDRIGMKTLEEGAIRRGETDPIEVDLKERIRDAKNRALKISGKKLSGTIAESIAKDILDSFPSDFQKWSGEQVTLFEQLMSQSLENAALGRSLYGDPRGINFAQKVFDKLDPGIREKLAEKEPQIQSSSSSRKKSGEELATNDEKFRNASARTFSDPEVIRGYKEAGGDMVALHDRIGKRAYSVAGEDAAKMQMDAYYKEAINNIQNPDQKKMVQRNINSGLREIGSNFIGENDLMREQYNLRKDSTFQNLNEEEQNRELELLEMKAIAKEFGITKLNDEEKNPDGSIKSEGFQSELNRLTLDQLEKTNVGQEIRENISDPEWAAMDEASKELTLRRIIGQKAKSYINNRPVQSQRIKEASAATYEGFKKGSKRAAIHSLASQALEVASVNLASNIVNKKWKDPSNISVRAKIGAATLQEKMEYAADLGDKNISDFFGNVKFDDNTRDEILRNSSAKKRQRIVGDLSEAMAKLHSGNTAEVKDAKSIFKNYGINLDEVADPVAAPGLTNRQIILNKHTEAGESKMKSMFPSTGEIITNEQRENVESRFRSQAKEYKSASDSKVDQAMAESMADKFSNGYKKIVGGYKYTSHKLPSI